MATYEETTQAILDLIVEAAKAEAISGMPGDAAAMRMHQADVILRLSEAYAWLRSPDRPHGS
jgi:hypothetical protein